MTGNLDASEAAALSEQLAAAVGPGCTLAASSRPLESAKELPEGRWCCYTQQAKNPQEDNTAVQIYYQVGEVNQVLKTLSGKCDVCFEEPVIPWGPSG